MTAAGYPNVGAGDVPFGMRIGPANLAFSQPWGAVGIPRRRRGGAVRLPGSPGSALSALGIDVTPLGHEPG